MNENEPTAGWQPENEQAPEPSRLRWIFFGPDGLRAGWSILLYFLIAVILAAVVQFAVKHLIRPIPRPPGSDVPWRIAVLSEWVQFAVFALAAFGVSRVEHRSFASYGIDPLGKRRALQFGAGTLWGFGLLSLLILLLRGLGLLHFDRVVLHGAPVLGWAVAWAVAFLGVGMFEEFFTRGFLQFTLARGAAGLAKRFGARHAKTIGFWSAAVFFSLLFSLGHKANAGESPIGLLSAGLIGLVFAFSLWRTGSLWWAIGWHAAWDWAQSFLWSVPDSGNMMQHHLLAARAQGSVVLNGGLTGPEGSVFVLPVIALTALIIEMTLRPEPGSPSWDLAAPEQSDN